MTSHELLWIPLIVSFGFLALAVFLSARRILRIENSMHARLTHLSDRASETSRKLEIVGEKLDKLIVHISALSQEMDGYLQQASSVLDRNTNNLRCFAAILKDELDEIETLDRRIIELEYKAPVKTPQEMAQEQHEARRVKLRRMRRTLGAEE